MSSEPTVVIRLDGDLSTYQPGETLSGEYWIESVDLGQIKTVEVSVLWATEGKGDEDMAVHEFWCRDADDGRPIELGRPERFSTTLPNSPLSYQGQIIKLRWCVRVRVFPARGKEVVGEKVFHLGNVPPIRAKAAPHVLSAV
jgi:hypothetical protein